MLTPFVWVFIALGGAALGFIGGYILIRPKNKRIEKLAISEAEKIRQKARKEGERIIKDSERQSETIRRTLQREEKTVQKRLDTMQTQFDIRIEKRERILEEKIDKSDASKEKFDQQFSEYKEKNKELAEKLGSQNQVLADIAKLTKEEAQIELLARMEKEISPKLAQTLKRKVSLMQEEAEREAQNVLVQSIQRFASRVSTEGTTSSVKLKSDDIKGKIIGREGRNINAFEMITGVDLIIDDTPGTVTLSCYDMYRRYVAKIVLERLLKDGRIHPGSIEAETEKAEKEAEQLLLKLGKEAAEELNIVGLPDEILKLTGRLRFRTSYGQNVLNHSKEVAWLAEAIATQIPGADPYVCKKAGLVHDIGKAVSHEVEGGHAIIGKDILEKFGVEKPVVQAMMSHHEDFPYETVEARILQAADAISAARPGARRETLEKYIKRLKQLEGIAAGFEGVKKAYCIQAGREVRVFVNSAKMDDFKAEKTAFDMARAIEAKADYPGEVKVTVIRERRWKDVAK